MKKIQTITKIAKWASIACFFILLNTSCNNDLNLIEGSKDVPIVYGFLSLNDTAVYIRVEHAFVDAKTPPATIAQVADSLYYANAIVTLVRVSNNEKFVLTRVNGNTEGYVRNDGIFAKAPNYLYKRKTADLGMRADEQWKITIQRTGDAKIVAQATTKVVGDNTITAPQANAVLVLKYDLVANTSNAFNVRMETMESSARAYDVKVIVNYDEVIGSVRTAKTAEWLLASGTIRQAASVQTNFSGRNAKDFYTFLSNTIPVNTAATRFFKTMDVELTAVGPELIEAATVGIANIGITGSQAIPTYTNVENGLGVFSSRNKTIVKGVKLNSESLDLLTNGELTKNLNFR